MPWEAQNYALRIRCLSLPGRKVAMRTPCNLLLDPLRTQVVPIDQQVLALDIALLVNYTYIYITSSSLGTFVHSFPFGANHRAFHPTTLNHKNKNKKALNWKIVLVRVRKFPLIPAHFPSIPLTFRKKTCQIKVSR